MSTILVTILGNLTLTAELTPAMNRTNLGRWTTYVWNW